MKIKYQVFISSTYEDLKSEREQVIKAILEMGHIPVGMEMFSAGDEQQWELIKRQIEDCDYYVILLAHRYGSMDGVISYTEKEYDYALSKQIPILGFVIDDKANWPKTNMDSETIKIGLLAAFKEKVKKKIINYWKSPEELHGKVSIAIMKAMTAQPRTGWVKATESVGPEVLTEITRLSKENSELKQKLFETKTEKQVNEAAEIEKIISLLKNNVAQISFMYKDAKDWEEEKEISYYKIFNLLAPEMAVEKSTVDTAHYIGHLYKDEKRDLRNSWPIPSNTIREILADFYALNLLEPSTKKHLAKDDNEYWSLSEEGKKVYTRIKIQRLEIGSLKKKSEEFE